MNDATRKDVAAQLRRIFDDNTFQDIADEVKQLADDEREKYDNVEAEFGENAPQLEALEEAADTLEEAADKLEEAAQLADEAADLLSTIAGA
jgi:methyl-accepting chemotaxis protein